MTGKQLAQYFVLVLETIWVNTLPRKVSIHGYTLRPGHGAPVFFVGR